MAETIQQLKQKQAQELARQKQLQTARARASGLSRENQTQRKGKSTVIDAVEGFDRYIEGAADVIYQTDNIQRLRALSAYIRYETTDDGARERIDQVRANGSLSDTDKELRIREIYDKSRFYLSNFVVELDEYTNLLANKRSQADRNMERMLGRSMYNVVKTLEGRVAANMVAINPGSWITNFVPLVQGAASLEKGHIWKGMWDTLQAIKNDDGFVDASDFLTNRRGSDPLIRTWQQKTSALLSTPMEWIDCFTADSLVRARYQQNLEKGLSQAAAMEEADQWTAGVMADRSKGAMPTLFAQNNPLTKLFTQFQLEVNNQLSYVFKDLPREAGDKDKYALALAAMLFKFSIFSYLFNDVYEWLYSRRPALDPIGILNDTSGDLFGFALPNAVDFVTGADRSLEARQTKASEALSNLGTNVLEEMPFVGGLMGGGRLPISSALPDVGKLVNAATNESWSGKKRLTTAATELGRPLTYVALPFGGGQLKKIFEGLKAVRERGSYSVNAAGEEELQYPIHYSNGLEMLLAYSKAITFGKSSFKSAQEWVDSGFSGLSAKQTEAYRAMVENGADSEAAYDLIEAVRSAGKTDAMSQAEARRKVLRDSNLSDDNKAIVYYQMLANDSEVALMDAMIGEGTDPGKLTQVLMGIKDASAMTVAKASCAKRNAIADADLSEQEKITLYRELISDSRDEDIRDFRAVGLDFEEFLKIQNQYATINETVDGATAKATDLSRWLDGQAYNAEQKETIQDVFTYFSQIPASSTRYDKLVEAGLEPDEAYRLTDTLASLEPLPGQDQVQDAQKWRAACQISASQEVQMQALKGVMSENSSAYEKLRIAYDEGIPPMAYVRLKEIMPQFDANGSGSYSQDEIKAAIDSMCSSSLVLPGGDGTIFFLTNAQKATLWQLWSTSKSAKNNPYDSDAGWAVLEKRNAG